MEFDIGRCREARHCASKPYPVDHQSTGGSQRLPTSGDQARVTVSTGLFNEISQQGASDSLALAGFSVLFVVEARLATAWHRTLRLPMSATQSAPKRRLHSSWRVLPLLVPARDKDYRRTTDFLSSPRAANAPPPTMTMWAEPARPFVFKATM